MKFKLIKDHRLRKKYNQNEKERTLNKFMYINFLNSDYTDNNQIKREIGLFLATRLDKGVSKTKVVRRCVLTGRGRVNYSKRLKISRIKMREIIKSGVISSFSKALW
jgi:ribosomal protein S14